MHIDVYNWKCQEGKPMKTSELLKRLKDGGCIFVREGDNHEVWYSPITKRKFEVWRHKKELPSGTANAILKQAGLK